jgi:outer membrane murein-binding lipoprotein Lpp
MAMEDDVDESKLSVLEKTGSADVQELVAEVRRLRRDLEGTEATAALTVASQNELARSARSLNAVLAEARIEYDALPEHVRAVIRHGSAMRRLLDERLYGKSTT